MKELLYLKDEQIKDFIQLLFYAYRETFLDPKKILSEVRQAYVNTQSRSHIPTWDKQHFHRCNLEIDW